MKVSRRSFLTLSGIAVLPAWLGFQQSSMAHSHVRALRPAHVHLLPFESASILNDLQPDSVHAVQWTSAQWLRVDKGYVHLRDMQVMLPDFEQHTNQIQTPAWLEITAPFTAIRQYASATAPLVRRANHGDVFEITYQFHDDEHHWWGKTTIGWLQIDHTRQIPDVPSPVGNMIAIDIYQATQHIAVSHHGTVLRKLDASIPTGLNRAIEIQRLVPGAEYGRPWNIVLSNDWVIHGEGSHNDFGRRAPDTDVRRVELSTIDARWLYYMLNSARGASISVHR